MHTILVPPEAKGVKPVLVMGWRKNLGEGYAAGDVLVDLELEESILQLVAQSAGKLTHINAAAGQSVEVGAVLATAELGEFAKPVAEVAKNVATLQVAPVTIAESAQVETSGKQNDSGAKQEVKAVSSSSASAAPGGAVVPFLMPQAGNSMEEGTVVAWRVKEGDRVTVGQILLEVETDKATVEVEATDAGRIARIVAQAGAVVPVKQPVAFLAENDADVEAFLAAGGAGSATAAPEASAGASVQESAGSVAEVARGAASVTESGRVKASPAARKMANEKGLDLATIGAGSGPDGRILSTDVLNAKSGAANLGVAKPAARSAASGDVIRKPMSKMRRAIANNLQTSKQTVPHFYIKGILDAAPLMSFYKAKKPATGCTLNDVVILAVGKVVGEFPAFRSRIEGNEIVELPGANIGVAVSVDDGLVVPVIMGVDRMDLATLAKESKRIVEAGRSGKLENVGKGVFTISNMGMLGVDEFSAIINPPESGILAVGAAKENVIVKDGALKAGRTMNITLSVDHRVVDGALAAQFLKRLKELLENPDALV